jgi:hypothetical protein
VQFRSVAAAIRLGVHHCDHFSLKASQTCRIRHGPCEQLSEWDVDIGVDRQKTTHVGHELDIGFGLATPRSAIWEFLI